MMLLPHWFAFLYFRLFRRFRFSFRFPSLFFRAPFLLFFLLLILLMNFRISSRQFLDRIRRKRVHFVDGPLRVSIIVENVEWKMYIDVIHMVRRRVSIIGRSSIYSSVICWR